MIVPPAQGPTGVVYDPTVTQMISRIYGLGVALCVAGVIGFFFTFDYVCVFHP